MGQRMAGCSMKLKLRPFKRSSFLRKLIKIIAEQGELEKELLYDYIHINLPKKIVDHWNEIIEHNEKNSDEECVCYKTPFRYVGGTRNNISVFPTEFEKELKEI